MADPVNRPVHALARITWLPPDLSVALKPFPVHYSQAKTISASATATAGSPAATQTWLSSSVAPKRLGALRLDLVRTP